MRGEPDSSKIYSDIGKSSVKCKQMCVYHLSVQTKLTCLIHGLVHSSYEIKVLKYFGNKYSKVKLFKELRKDPKYNTNFGNNREVNAIVQHTVDDIILHETGK